MCGGELEIVPCSRVGHVFRKRRPYSSDGKYNSMEVNSMRLAEVWMDGYKEQFYKMRAGLKGKQFGDISARLGLRRKLKCRSFQWFLDNVYPEIKSPGNFNLMHKKKHFNPAILLKGKVCDSPSNFACMNLFSPVSLFTSHNLYLGSLWVDVVFHPCPSFVNTRFAHNQPLISGN